jgi:Domain of unknown function (DUF6134)
MKVDAMNARRSIRGRKMIGRRSVLLTGTVLFARRADAGLPVPRGGSLAFRMVRHGGEIGMHALNFQRVGDLLTVRIAVDALVTFASIPIARYMHRGVETWQGTTLIALTGETNKNGDHQWMNARRSGDGLVVLGSQTKRYIAPDNAIPTSYWNKRMLDGPMISLEDGVLLAPKVADLRIESIRLASGRMIAADHYNLSGAFAVDLWYDETATWAGMALTVGDGSEVHYERL